MEMLKKPFKDFYLRNPIRKDMEDIKKRIGSTVAKRK